MRQVANALVLSAFVMSKRCSGCVYRLMSHHNTPCIILCEQQPHAQQLQEIACASITALALGRVRLQTFQCAYCRLCVVVVFFPIIIIGAGTGFCADRGEGESFLFCSHHYQPGIFYLPQQDLQSCQFITKPQWMLSESVNSHSMFIIAN